MFRLLLFLRQDALSDQRADVGVNSAHVCLSVTAKPLPVGSALRWREQDVCDSAKRTHRPDDWSFP